MRQDIHFQWLRKISYFSRSWVLIDLNTESQFHALPSPAFLKHLLYISHSWDMNRFLLQRGWEKCNPKGKVLAHGKVLVLKYSEEAKERGMTAKPALVSKSMVSKCFKCMLLHLLWEQTTREKTTHCQSLHLSGNWIINNTNPISSLPIHYWSISMGSDFERAGGYHCLYKLLDKAGVLVKTMFMQQWNEDNAPKNKDMLLPTDQWLDSSL